jgi:hypothetical protein
VPVTRAAARWFAAGKRDVDRALVQRNLPLDVLPPPLDKIVVAHNDIISELGLES